MMIYSIYNGDDAPIVGNLLLYSKNSIFYYKKYIACVHPIHKTATNWNFSTLQLHNQCYFVNKKQYYLSPSKSVNAITYPILSVPVSIILNPSYMELNLNRLGSKSFTFNPLTALVNKVMINNI